MPITGFVQSQPDAGYPATEETVVRVLYDDRKLYIGALCYDSEPDKLVITTLEYGLKPSTHDMDVFAITLDTFLDRQNAFVWLVNPRGAYRDGQVFNDSRSSDWAWRGVVEVEAMPHDSGWTVEMAIPWTTLRFDPTRGDGTWGMQMMRRVRRKSEDSYWAPVDRRDPVHRMSRAGSLVGLQGVSPGRNLKVKPFVFGTDLSGTMYPADSAVDDGFEAGLDVKFGLTSGLTLDLTYNTDFSQAEVDQQRVNFTRFPLFFPEQREFFVENSGSFVLGDVTERNYRMGSSLRDFTLFHSRRIGLAADRRPIPIMLGGRVTGREGSWEVGLLDIQTESFESRPAENFGVVRLRRNLGSSDVGLMFINRQATGSLSSALYNRSYGVDANLHLLNNMIVNSYVTRTDEPGAEGDQWAGRLSVAWRDRMWDASGFVKHIGDAFNPGVGFVRRRGIRHGYVTFGAHPRPGVTAIQEVNPYAELHYVTDLDSRLLTREAVAGFGIQFLDGSSLNLRYLNGFERLDEPFYVRGNEIPEGEYRIDWGSASYSSSRARSVSARLTVGGGDYWTGSRISVSGQATLRASHQLTVDLTGSHDDISLSSGSFSTNLVGTRIGFAFNTALFVSAYVQYNGDTDQVISNARLNWIHAPLSDAFLVYTERRDLTNDVTLERAVTLKFTRMFAF
jgi:hypothetical protein